MTNIKFCPECGSQLMNGRLANKLTTLNFNVRIRSNQSRNPFAFPELDELYQQLQLNQHKE